jgi:hypothetical protein
METASFRTAPRRLAIPLAALAFTYLFFFEYLRPFSWVHIPYDLEGYHYPLADYAFQALKHGRFPEWDPTIYCGLPFAGNPQAALFYPPMWLAFLADGSRAHLSYTTMEALVIAHVWAAFLLCFGWLRYRRLSAAASALGGGVFAFSGYMLLQLQHLGYIGAYTWIPLGLWGIEEAAQLRRWRPLWKLVAASALALLAGHPPTWVVFAVCMLAYAGCRRQGWRTASAAALALAISWLVAAVQLFPAWEASGMKLREIAYSGGIRTPAFYLSYLVPNYFDFGMNVNLRTHPGMEYLYLGAPFLPGMAALLWRRRWREAGPLLGVGGAALVVVLNPFGIVEWVVLRSPFLSQTVRDWCFLAGITPAAAGLAAIGWDSVLDRRSASPRPWLAWLAIAGLAGWSGRLLWIWFHRRLDFGSGAAALVEPAAMLGLVVFAAMALGRSRGRLHATLIAALLLTVGVDYKVFGTSKRFNAWRGPSVPSVTGDAIREMDDISYALLRVHRENRVALDPTTSPQNLRFNGMRTPQGFDPLLPAQMKRAIERLVLFRSNWMFDIDPGNEEALRLFGIRYVVLSEANPLYKKALDCAHLRLREPATHFYKVFEYTGAVPPDRWESPGADRSADRVWWSPERREYRVRSVSGGWFTSGEQYYPGWTARLDGQPIAIERRAGMLQAVVVPPGEHRLEFRYASSGLRWGALISLLAIGGLVAAWFRDAARNASQGLRP